MRAGGGRVASVHGVWHGMLCVCVCVCVATLMVYLTIKSLFFTSSLNSLGLNIIIRILLFSPPHNYKYLREALDYQDFL